MSSNCVGHKMAVVLVSDMRVVVMIKDRKELSEGKIPRKGKRISYDQTSNDDTQEKKVYHHHYLKGSLTNFTRDVCLI